MRSILFWLHRLGTIVVPSLLLLALTHLPGYTQGCPEVHVYFGTLAITNGCNKISATWVGSHADRYRWEAQGSGTYNEWVILYEGTATSGSYDIPTHWRDTQMNFRVTAWGCENLIHYTTNPTGLWIPLNTPKPTSVDAVVLANRKIRVSWNSGGAPGDAIAKIYRGSVWVTDVSYSNGQTPELTEPCGTHTYSVQCVTYYCQSELAAAEPVTTFPAAPVLLLPAHQASVEGPSVAFSWETTCGATSYTIQVDDNSNFSSPLVDSPTELTSYPWASAPAGAYFWRVRATNTAGGTDSPIRNLTVTAPPEPPPPLVLISPLGGQTWAPGSQQTIQWSGSYLVKIEIFADVTSAGQSLSGPKIVDTVAFGSSKVITIPSNVVTTRARVQVSVQYSGGTVYSFSPGLIRIVPLTQGPGVSFSAVDSPNHGWNQSDMCSNGAGGVEAVYFDYLSGQDLRHASRLGRFQSWTPSVVESASQIGSWPAVVKGADGRLHVAYHDQTLSSANLYYRCRDASGWQEPYYLWNTGVVQGDCSITLDQNDRPVIAFNTGDYQSFNFRRLAVFAQDAGGQWGQVGEGFDASSPHHITVKSYATKLWVSYIDQNGGRLNLLKYDSSVANPQWTSVAGTYPAGPYTDVSMDLSPAPNPSPMLAYAAAAPNGGQKLVFHPWLANGSGLGTFTVIDNAAATISGVSLRYNFQYPRIAYVGNGVVKQAVGAYSASQYPVSWTNEVVDFSGNMDSQVSLVVDPTTDTRWFLYRDLTTQSMRSAVTWLDTVAPAAPDYLTVTGSCYDYLTISWPATGDDGNSGIASSYDLRWSSSPITTEAAFNSAQSVSTGQPQEFGYIETVMVEVGECSSIRYFAIKVRDDAENLSPLRSGQSGAVTSCLQPPHGCMEFLGEVAGAQAIPVTRIAGIGPNPAMGPTAINFGVGAVDAQAALDLAVFDVTGRKVAGLQETNPGAGNHEVVWNLSGANGRRVSAGLYFVSLRIGAKTMTQRLVVTH